jgi:hypothetical protein
MKDFLTGEDDLDFDDEEAFQAFLTANFNYYMAASQKDETIYLASPSAYAFYAENSSSQLVH